MYHKLACVILRKRADLSPEYIADLLTVAEGYCAGSTLQKQYQAQRSLEELYEECMK